MSFIIKLATTLSDKRCLDKTITILKELNGTLRDSTSIIDPVIAIECSDVDMKSINYLVIDDFKRSYFVNDIKSIRNNVWEISCHVDVLSSFASEIRTNSAITKRQESDWNLYINDESFRCYQDPYIVQKQFPKGFAPESSSYVLLVAGKPHSSQVE